MKKTIFFALFMMMAAATSANDFDDSTNARADVTSGGDTTLYQGAGGRIVLTPSLVKEMYHGGIAASKGVNQQYHVSYPYLYMRHSTNYGWSKVCNISSGSCLVSTNTTFGSKTTYYLQPTGVDIRSESISMSSGISSSSSHFHWIK